MVPRHSFPRQCRRGSERARAALPGAVLAALILLTGCQGKIRPPYPVGPVAINPLAVPHRQALSPRPGAVTLVAAWQLTSRHYRFGSYSALLPLPGGQLLAINDRGFLLRFSPPDSPPKAPPFITRVAPDDTFFQTSRDSESATIDPTTGRIWVGWERSNAITRQDPGAGQPLIIKPPAMARWFSARGAEAMVRLTDGRFLVLCEGYTWPDYDGVFGERRHAGLLFPGDPVAGAIPARFTYVGPAGFSPVDLAQLPDGRVLILMRKLVWPFPAKFAGRIVVADPGTVRPGRDWTGTVIAALPSDLADNFEGMGIVPATKDTVTVWLISDSNDSEYQDSGNQRTLLWKLAVDPARLP